MIETQYYAGLSPIEQIAEMHLNLSGDYKRWAGVAANKRQPDYAAIEILLKLAHETEFIATRIDLEEEPQKGKVRVKLTLDQLAKETSRYLGRFVGTQTIKDDLIQIRDDIPYQGFQGYTFKRRASQPGKANLLIFPDNPSRYANRQFQHAESH
ncbi:MAG: hypothetical protein AABX32_03750 [Nanoarchaeota archaeon]